MVAPVASRRRGERALDDELTGLLSSGERAAFHGRPAAGIPPLERARELARGGDREAEATAADWLLGVCLTAAGRYGSALQVLRPLAEHAPQEPERRVFAALAAATMASVYRQMGRHAEGREHDSRALDLAEHAAEAQFDAHLGLAADAVGLGDIATAGAELGQAVRLAEGRREWWRQRVRLDWVRAEVDLLGDDADAARGHAESAIALAEHSGAPRHVAKGLLFLGVAQVQSGQNEDAADTLRRSASLAESLGALPLVWPARAVLSALLAGSGPEESQRCLAVARQAVRRIAEDLDPTDREAWLARPDVAAVLTEVADGG